MGNFPTRPPPLTGDSALKTALDLCHTNGGYWKSADLKEALHTRSEKSYGKIVAELIDETDHLATTDPEKAGKAKEVLDCFMKEPIKDPEINARNYSQVLGFLFRSSPPLSLAQKRALTAILSQGIKKPELLYYLGIYLGAENNGFFKKNYLNPFIIFVSQNYSPDILNDSLPKQEICEFFIQQEGINPQDKKIFNEEFCPRLANERVAKERGVLYQALTETGEEETFLERLEELKESFKDKKDFLAYLESKNYTIPYLLKPVQTLKGLGHFFSIFSPDAQTRMVYRIWFHLQKDKFPNLKWSELKGINLTHLLDTLTAFWKQRAPVEYPHPTFFSFSLRKNPLTDSSLSSSTMKRFLIENIRKNLSPEDQEKFNQEISPSKLSKNL